MHRCQLVAEEGLSRGGLGADVLVQDRAAGRPLGPSRALGAAGYVGNFMVQGAPRSRISAAGRSASAALTEHGFSVHEDAPDAVDAAEFVGLLFDGRARAVRVTPRRTRRLCLAIDELLSRKRCSGQVMEAALGHATWPATPQRPTLSILNSAYSFARPV